MAEVNIVFLFYFDGFFLKKNLIFFFFQIFSVEILPSLKAFQ